MIIYNKSSRRLFLKTAAGHVLALPLLPSLIAKSAGAAIADSISLEQIPNTILIRTVYGCFEVTKYIKDIPGEDPANKWTNELISFGPQNQPRGGILRTKDLAGYDDNGVYHPISDLFGTAVQEAGLLDYLTITLGNTGFHGANHNHTSAFCGTGTLGDTDFPRIKQSSIDVLIEEKLKSLNPNLKTIRSMPAGKNSTASGSNSWKYNKSNDSFTRLSYLDNLDKLFNMFFKAAPADTNAIRKAAMDNVQEEYRKLATLVSPEEKMLLEKYADDIQEVSALIGTNKIVCNSPTYGPVDMNKISTTYKASNTLITQAFKCGLSKLAVLDFVHDRENNFDPSAYAASHHPKDGSTLNHKANQFNRDLILDLGKKLMATPNNSGGNLLDDSIIFQTSEDNWNHVADGGQPIMILGKAKGKINSGKIYDFRLRYGDDYSKENENLVYRINGNARSFGAIGWSPYYLLLEGIMQINGLKRNDYLLPGQFCYGHSELNWSSTYSGLRMKIDKFTDLSFKSSKKNGKWAYRSADEQTYFNQPENFPGPTPKLFNV